ncbi:hypothetical protein COOONC_20931 [Cooperia oncophora]
MFGSRQRNISANSVPIRSIHFERTKNIAHNIRDFGHISVGRATNRLELVSCSNFTRKCTIAVQFTVNTVRLYSKDDSNIHSTCRHDINLNQESLNTSELT